MGITKTLIGVVAAAGVARLLAPHETDQMIKTAKRTVRGAAGKAKRKPTSMTKAATLSAPKVAAKAKTTARKATKKMAGKMKAPAKTRKAAKRPARKASR